MKPKKLPLNNPLASTFAVLLALCVTAFTFSACSSGGNKESTVAVSGISLSPPTMVLQMEATPTGTLTATVSPAGASNKAVTWTTSNSNVATVSGTGLVVTINAVGDGSATITATTQDGAKTATCQVAVSPAPIREAVSLSKNTMTLAAGDATGSLVASVIATPAGVNGGDSGIELPAFAYLYAAGDTVNWASSDTSKATVNSAGTVTPISTGSVTVTADSGKTVATCFVEIVKDPIPAIDAYPAKYEMALVTGGSELIAVTFMPSIATDQNIDWKNSNTDVVTVSGNGVVTALSPGEAEIRAWYTSESRWLFPAPIKIVVAASPVAVTGIEMNEDSLTLAKGYSQALVATLQPSNATNQNINWITTNPAKAIVSSTGVVTALEEGVATIVAITEDGGNVATCDVTVTDHTTTIEPASVSLNKKAITIFQGESETLVATVLPSDATNKNLYWHSNNHQVAIVTSTGTVIGIARGTAIVTAVTIEGNKTDTCTVTVDSDEVPVTGISLNKDNIALLVGETDTLRASLEPTTATDQGITWASDNTRVATVNNGVVTAIAVGSTAIRVTAHDGGFQATCTVTVSEPVRVTGIHIDKTSLDMTIGNQETLTATVVPDNAANRAVVWESEDPSIATVSAGVVTAVAVGSTIITVTTEDGGYQTGCHVTIRPPMPNTDIYVVGLSISGSQSAGVLWKNGVATALTDYKANVRAYSVTESNGNVYVAGQEDNLATLWTNGVAKRILPHRSTAQDVIVSGSDIYVSGLDMAWNSTTRMCPLIWKNGNIQYLDAYPTGIMGGYSSFMFVEGSDVYALACYAETSSRYVSTLYKNGEAMQFPSLFRPSGLSGCISVSGGNVYLVGQIGTEVGAGVSYSQALLANGVPQPLGDNNGSYSDFWFSSVFTSGTDVYVAGSADSNGEEVGILWKNSVPQHIEGAYYINNIHVLDGDVYLVGLNKDNKATLWINGVPYPMDDVNATPNNIHVSRR
ncbi:MAG: Ig-like domain-containing protein [Holophagaceae bacterium]|nr:Ig-like domain-containing protein [Holophagaceae bacterium]